MTNEQVSSASVKTTTSQSSGRIIVILGMLAAFAPIATDMYLPAFPQMAVDFKVPEGGIEITLSIFFLGLAIGQAIYGPLIDRFGRRRPLLVGIGLYVATTVLCLLLTDIGIFVGLRFLQAVGGCAGIIIGRAIIRDLFDERDSARAFSSLLVVMTLAPILAPILGGLILSFAGWKAIFGFILAFGLGCALLVWGFIPETLAPEDRRKESPVAIGRAWLSLVTDRAFIVPAMVGGLAQACMFAFITGSPAVFINQHGASAQSYGFLFALIACALIVAAQANRIALRWKTPESLLSASLILNLVAGVGTVLAVATGSLPLLLIPLWFAIGALGFIGADAAALAMAACRRHAGSGSALVGVLQFGCAFVVSSLVAACQNGTAYPMTLAIAGCGLLASILWFLASARRAS
ncbi:MAG: multidrug effflux MFS transporter [Verrucomicrobiota bacterium JB025]|nr:multidrug effflux MFS transporter [Verrucomicrobiota bacterium JB025]